MKVALFHTTLPQQGEKSGGVAMTVHRLANALVRHESLDITLFSCDPKPEDALYQHSHLFNGRLGTRLKRLTLLPLALNQVDFSGFDVLHLHGDDWFFVRRTLPTVRSLHGSALREAQSATHLRRRLLQYIIYPLEHLSARLATLTLGGGLDAARLYSARGMADNGVDTALFAPRPKADYPLLAYVGGWDGRKRGAFAYRTFVERILPTFPDAKLYMACDRVPIHDGVIDGGVPDDRTLADWLGKAWVFAYPSTYEGFGIPYIEAMASGTPIVTTRNSGADYVLDRGRFGVLTDDSGFADAVIDLLRDRNQREALAKAGFERANLFTWPNVARAHAEFYRRAIAEFRAPATGDFGGARHSPPLRPE